MGNAKKTFRELWNRFTGRRSEQANLEQFKKKSIELVMLLYEIADKRIGDKQSGDFSEEDRRLASVTLAVNGAIRRFIDVCEDLQI